MIILALSALPNVLKALTVSSSSAMLGNYLKAFFIGFGGGSFILDPTIVKNNLPRTSNAR